MRALPLGNATPSFFVFLTSPSPPYHLIHSDAPDETRAWKLLESQGLAVGTARPIDFVVRDKTLLTFGGYAGDQPTSMLRALNLETLEWSFVELWMAMDSAAVSTIATSESSKSTKPYARYGHCQSIDSEGTIYVFFGTGSMYLTDIVELASLE